MQVISNNEIQNPPYVDICLPAESCPRPYSFLQSIRTIRAALLSPCPALYHYQFCIEHQDAGRVEDDRVEVDFRHEL